MKYIWINGSKFKNISHLSFGGGFVVTPFMELLVSNCVFDSNAGSFEVESIGSAFSTVSNGDYNQASLK